MAVVHRFAASQIRKRVIVLLASQLFLRNSYVHQPQFRVLNLSRRNEGLRTFYHFPQVFAANSMGRPFAVKNYGKRLKVFPRYAKAIGNFLELKLLDDEKGISSGDNAGMHCGKGPKRDKPTSRGSTGKQFRCRGCRPHELAPARERS